MKNTTTIRQSARTGAAALACCVVAAAAGACSGGNGSKNPASGVTAPSISGKPAMAASVDAALAKQAFTPYAGLGTVADDGLAPNESLSTLVSACMTTAGYPADADTVPFSVNLAAGLSLTMPFGDWGYVGADQAAKSGFLPAPGGNLAAIGLNRAPGSGPTDLSTAEQAAVDKCTTLVNGFETKQSNTSLAGITALGQAIVADVAKDPSVVRAMADWSACMTNDGYNYSAPKALDDAEMQSLPHHSGPDGPSLSPGQESAQTAAAEADAACTESSDLDGIYFAAQASYEQQIVETNQQQLDAAVQQYRTAYQKETADLAALLASASPDE